MKWLPSRPRKLHRSLILSSLGCLLLLTPLAESVVTGADPSPPPMPAWTNPSAITVKRITQTLPSQNAPYYLHNLDCSLIDYRQTASTTMETGCFSLSALGMIDPDTTMTIFNGTDEAVPIVPYVADQTLVPWPGALNMLALTPAVTGGDYLSMYRNPLPILQDQRDYLGRLTKKRLTAPAELPLVTQAGQQLIINPRSLAFSDSGAWLVAETLNGYFVRINLASLEPQAFAASFSEAGRPGALSQAAVAVSEDGQYVAAYDYAAEMFNVYQPGTCNTAAPAVAVCPFHNYLPYLQQHIDGLKSVQHVRFLNDGLLSFEAVSTDSTKNGVYELAPASSIDSLTGYIGLGDSFTSGEGAFDYLDGTDTPQNHCHNSQNAYPHLLTHDLFTANSGHSVACSGAIINDVGSTSQSYHGQVAGSASWQQLQTDDPTLLTSVETNFIPGYIAQHRFVQQYQPGVITVSVGGNDIGFGDILEQCVIPHISRHLSDSTCFNNYEARVEVTNLIDRTVPRWTALLRQLQVESPGTKIYAIGYPQIINDQGSCGLNVHLNQSELEFGVEVVNYLNGALAKGAAAAGVQYVDISHALDGHKLCEATAGSIAVNGLTAGTDSGALGIEMFGRESYHPNALGQTLIEAAILRATDNLSKAIATPPSAISSEALLQDQPKTGQPIHQRIPTRFTPEYGAAPGSAIHIAVDGPSAGLRSDATYEVHLDGPAGPLLSTVTTRSDGSIDSSVSLPPEADTGGHGIDVTGPGQTDTPVDITQPIIVSDGSSQNDTGASSSTNSGEQEPGPSSDTEPGNANPDPSSSASSLQPTGDDTSTSAPPPPGTRDSSNSDAAILNPQVPDNTPLQDLLTPSGNTLVQSTLATVPTAKVLETLRAAPTHVIFSSVINHSAPSRIFGVTGAAPPQHLRPAIASQVKHVKTRLPAIQVPRWILLILIPLLFLIAAITSVAEWRIEKRRRASMIHRRSGYRPAYVQRPPVHLQ